MYVTLYITYATWFLDVSTEMRQMRRFTGDIAPDEKRAGIPQRKGWRGGNADTIVGHVTFTYGAEIDP